MMRSHYCGQLNESLDGQEVTLCGWVHRRRDHEMCIRDSLGGAAAGALARHGFGLLDVRGVVDVYKRQALQLRTSRRGLHLTDEVGRSILNRGSRSMNSLFDLLEQLDRASLQAQRKLTIPFLKETLGW